MGIDRDEDSYFDRDELDTGSDPADPLSVPPPPPGSVTLLSGRRIFVRDVDQKPWLRRFKAISRDSDILIEPPGGPGDPTLGDAFLRLANPSGEQTIIPLPREGWRLLGPAANPKGYRYRDLRRERGPCTRVLLRPGRILKAVCRGDEFLFTLDETSQGSLTVTLQTGTGAMNCLSFGGEVLKDEGIGVNGSRGVFKARDAEEPASCPLP